MRWKKNMCSLIQRSVEETYLRESLEDVCQHLQRRLSACVMLIVQLGHHKVQMPSELPSQRVVQQVLQIDLHNTKKFLFTAWTQYVFNFSVHSREEKCSLTF